MGQIPNPQGWCNTISEAALDQIWLLGLAISAWHPQGMKALEGLLKPRKFEFGQCLNGKPPGNPLYTTLHFRNGRKSGYQRNQVNQTISTVCSSQRLGYEEYYLSPATRDLLVRHTRHWSFGYFAFNTGILGLHFASFCPFIHSLSLILTAIISIHESTHIFETY